MSQRSLSDDVRSYIGKLLSAGAGPWKDIRGLLSATEFYEALHKERARADRTGLPLSLIVIWEVDDKSGSPETAVRSPELLAGVAAHLVERLRCTDLVGNYEASKVGVLLPHTSAQDAWNVLEDLNAALVHEFGTEEVTNRIFYRVHTTDLNGQFLDDGCVPPSAEFNNMTSVSARS